MAVRLRKSVEGLRGKGEKEIMMHTFVDAENNQLMKYDKKKRLPSSKYSMLMALATDHLNDG